MSTNRSCIKCKKRGATGDLRENGLYLCDKHASTDSMDLIDKTKLLQSQDNCPPEVCNQDTGSHQKMQKMQSGLVRSQSVGSGDVLGHKDAAKSAERRLPHQNLTNTGINACSLVHNELLYFVQNQQDGGVPHDDLINLVYNFYSEEKCDEAKSILNHMITTNLPDGEALPREAKNRIGPSRKSSIVSDILILMQHRSIVNASPYVRFVAAYSEHVPPISMKSIDASVLLKQLQCLFREVDQLKRACVTHDQLSDILDEEIRGNNTDTPPHQRHSGTPPPSSHASHHHRSKVQRASGSGNVVSGGKATTRGNASKSSVPAVTSLLPVGLSTTTLQRGHQHHQHQQQTRRAEQLLECHNSPASQHPPTPTDGNGSDNSRPDGYITVQSKARGSHQRGRANGATSKTSRRQMVIGSATGVAMRIKASAPARRVFITRLHSDTTADEIKHYLSDACNMTVETEQLVPKHNSYASVLVTCHGSEMEQIMSGELWPAGTLVKPFYSASRSGGLPARRDKQQHLASAAAAASGTESSATTTPAP